MARPKDGYFLQDGTKVPSVTTVTGRFKESGGLVHWAWRLGKEGKDYREERDAAASSGHLAHEMVERWIRESIDPPPLDEGLEDKTYQRALTSFGAFREWANQSNLEIAETENPLVSEQYRYGGTPDAIMVNNKLAIGDWKTSNAIYSDYLCQIRAYGNLWEENFPDKPIEGGYHLFRFDKEYGDFHHHWWGELDDAWEAFKHMRALYDLDRKLKQRIK